jgi:4-hydroxy-tetrahydrodipicolinate reductase
MPDIILFGCGALGTRLLRVLENDYAAINVVGAIDHSAALSGSTLGVACGSGRFADVTIMADLESCFASLTTRPEALVHMTESKPDRIEGQLRKPLEAGMNVISAAESMFYPWLRFPDFASRLNAVALANGVSLTGMGINPGFSYDTLPLLLARATSDVSAVRIRRCIDVTGTGPGDIEHVGYGLTPEDFREGVARGDIVGHMGAPESLALMAEFLDMDLELVTERWDLETAEVDVDSGDPTLGILPPGRVVGITQFAEGHCDGKVVMETRLSMYYRPEQFGLTECDEIEIDGAMPVRMRIAPAIESLFGASNVLASTILTTIEAQPGLINGLSLPLVGRRSSRRISVDESRETRPGNIPLRSEG